MTTEQRSGLTTDAWTLQAWHDGRVPFVGYSREKHLALGEDSILRLHLPGRTESALLRAGVSTISLLIEVLDSPIDHMGIRDIGDKGWQAIEEALERPLPSMIPETTEEEA